MKKIIFISLIVVILGALGAWYQPWGAMEDGEGGKDPKNLSYTVDGRIVKLVAGGATEAETNITTEYFGNEVNGDFDGNGVQDVAFLFTQQGGGSGTFFYVVAALGGADGFHGTNALFLGDRIAPQSTEFRDGVIIVNFADRPLDAPMSTEPSVSVSKYFRVADGVLVEVQNTPTDLSTGIQGTVQIDSAPLQTKLALTTQDGARVLREVFTNAEGQFALSLAPGLYSLRSATAADVKPYCTTTDAVMVIEGQVTTVTVSCTE